MPKRYFYRDALKAAWMYREFNMGFVTRNGSKLQLANTADFYTLKPYQLYLLNGYYLVAESSRPLLLPQDGDKDEDGFVFCTKTQAWWREFGEEIFKAKLPEESKTATRSGKPFFPPECEG